jgi:hypothetical protein
MMAGMAFGSAYPYWANCGLGSTVSHRQDIPDERSSWLELTWRLVAVTPDKVVLEMSMSSQYHGALVPSSKLPQTQEIFAGFPPFTEVPPGIEEGEEVFEVAGQALPCRWIQGSSEIEGKRVTVRTWLSARIPGGVAGSSTTRDGKTETTVVTSFTRK